MSFWGDYFAKLSENAFQVRNQASGGKLERTNGMKGVGNKVWNTESNSWIDAANPNDPNQQMKWAAGKAEGLQKTAEERSAELWDPNSKYNRSLLDYSMKFAHEMTPTSDSMYGALANSGMSNPGFFASKWMEGARAKAEDQGLTNWQGLLRNNQAQSQGYLSTAIQSNQFEQQTWQKQGQIEDEKNRRATEDWLGVFDQLAGVGGTLLTGGLLGGSKHTMPSPSDELYA